MKLQYKKGSFITLAMIAIGVLVNYQLTTYEIIMAPPTDTNGSIELANNIPEIELPNIDGELQSLKDWEGKNMIVNFWATWCKPCVEELPFFERINEEYKDQNVEVLLVSLDFPTQIEEKVLPFIEKNKIRSKVILMSDPDQNTWIPKIDETWSGAIPATIIYTKNKRAFYEKAFTYEELISELNEFLNL